VSLGFVHEFPRIQQVIYASVRRQTRHSADLVLGWDVLNYYLCLIFGMNLILLECLTLDLAEVAHVAKLVGHFVLTDYYAFARSPLTVVSEFLVTE
jgi:hypothetical protein